MGFSGPRPAGGPAMAFLWGVIPAGCVAALRPVPSLCRGDPGTPRARHLPRGRPGHACHGAWWSLLGSGERPGTWPWLAPRGTEARRRQEAGVAGVLGGGGTCRLGNRPGKLGPLVVSNYEAGTFLSMGEAWLRGVRGARLAGTLQGGAQGGAAGSGVRLCAACSGWGGEELKAEQGPRCGWRPSIPGQGWRPQRGGGGVFPGRTGLPSS